MSDLADFDSTSKGRRVKGTGYYGPLKRPDGKVSTELSVGVRMGGNEVEVPSLVPGLSKSEIATQLRSKESDPTPQSVVDKAYKHAKARVRSGQSPFARNAESPGGAEGRDAGEAGKSWKKTFSDE